MTNRPIFVGGMFKSGTSLVRAMLDQHPNIATGLETWWFNFAWPPTAEKDQKYLSRLGQFYDFEADEVHRLVGESGSVYEFLSLFLSTYAARKHKKRWAEKTPANVCHMDRILAGWPDAQIVHVVRDPKDVFASLCEAKKWNSVEEFTLRWCQVFTAVDAFLQHHELGKTSYLELRYELLVKDPVTATKRLCAFLDEPWSSQLASFNGRSGDYEKVLALTGKSSTTLKRLSEPLSAARVGIWRDLLSDAQISSVRAAVADQGLDGVFRRIEDATPKV